MATKRSTDRPTKVTTARATGATGATGTTRTTRATDPVKPAATVKPAVTVKPAAAAPRTYVPKTVSGGRTPTHEEIAARAYELFERRGGAHGHHEGDWIAAEAELRNATRA